jgi:hypothetical protein
LCAAKLPFFERLRATSLILQAFIWLRLWFQTLKIGQCKITQMNRYLHPFTTVTLQIVQRDYIDFLDIFLGWLEY